MTNQVFDSALHSLETIAKFKGIIVSDSRLSGRMATNDPRATAVFLAKRWGNHAGHIHNARCAVNELLDEKGKPCITENWEGCVKPPSWYTGPVDPRTPTDEYIGGGVNY